MKIKTLLPFVFIGIVLSCVKSPEYNQVTDIDTVVVAKDTLTGELTTKLPNTAYTDTTVMAHKAYSLNIQDSLMFELDKQNAEYQKLLDQQKAEYKKVWNRIQQLKKLGKKIDNTDSIQIKQDTLIINGSN